ncbi:hypothetical protein [Pasteuria penetrans]
MNYYGVFHPSKVTKAPQYLVNNGLKKWTKRRYKGLKGG